MKADKDRLKQFANQNKEAFEEEFLMEKESWKQIKKQLPTKKQYDLQIWWKAAAILLLASTITLLYERNTRNTELAYYEYYMLEQEERYLSKINQRKQQLTSYNEVQQQLPPGFGQEIYKLDSLYQVLRTDLMEGLHTDQLVDAMLLNLQMRVDLLDRQIQILEQIQELNEEKEKKYNYENAI